MKYDMFQWRYGPYQSVILTSSERYGDMNLSSLKLPAVLLSVVVLLFVTIYPWPDIAVSCKSSLLRVSLLVNDEPIDKFVLEEISDTRGPFVINPNDAVRVMAEIEPSPPGCTTTFFIDWELSFVVFSLSSVKTSVEMFPGEWLEIILGPHLPSTLGEDRIWLIERDASGNAIRQVSIRFKGESL
jgi:hypothetical protein